MKIKDFFNAEPYRSFFLMPSAEYRLEGVVPCLNFMFEVFAGVEVRVFLKPMKKTFGSDTSTFPKTEHKCDPYASFYTELNQPEFLGYHYLLLTPEDLEGYVPWETIPLVLLRGLLKGETKPQDITISQASDNSITYKIPKFKEEVKIPEKIANYLKNIGSFDGLVSKGIIIEKIGSIARNELDEFKVEQEVSPQKEKIERKDTGKAKAFRLFDEGKRPSDREVKALKIKSQILYRYYQEWKKIIRQ